MKNHECSWPFKKPVDTKVAVDYYEHIKYPMGKLFEYKILCVNYFILRNIDNRILAMVHFKIIFKTYNSFTKIFKKKQIENLSLD